MAKTVYYLLSVMLVRTVAAKDVTATVCSPGAILEKEGELQLLAPAAAVLDMSIMKKQFQEIRDLAQKAKAYINEKRREVDLEAGQIEAFGDIVAHPHLTVGESDLIVVEGKISDAVASCVAAHAGLPPLNKEWLQVARKEKEVLDKLTGKAYEWQPYLCRIFQAGDNVMFLDAITYENRGLRTKSESKATAAELDQIKNHGDLFSLCKLKVTAEKPYETSEMVKSGGESETAVSYYCLSDYSLGQRSATKTYLEAQLAHLAKLAGTAFEWAGLWIARMAEIKSEPMAAEEKSVNATRVREARALSSLSRSLRALGGGVLEDLPNAKWDRFHELKRTLEEAQGSHQMLDSLVQRQPSLVSMDQGTFAVVEMKRREGDHYNAVVYDDGPGSLTGSVYRIRSLQDGDGRMIAGRYLLQTGGIHDAEYYFYNELPGDKFCRQDYGKLRCHQLAPGLWQKASCAAKLVAGVAELKDCVLEEGKSEGSSVTTSCNRKKVEIYSPGINMKKGMRRVCSRDSSLSNSTNLSRESMRMDRNCKMVDEEGRVVGLNAAAEAELSRASEEEPTEETAAMNYEEEITKLRKAMIKKDKVTTMLIIVSLGMSAFAYVILCTGCMINRMEKRRKERRRLKQKKERCGRNTAESPEKWMTAAAKLL